MSLVSRWALPLVKFRCRQIYTQLAAVYTLIHAGEISIIANRDNYDAETLSMLSTQTILLAVFGMIS